MLGVSIDTLRNWEKEGKLTALRTEGGMRKYKKSDLKKLIEKTPKLAAKMQNVIPTNNPVIPTVVEGSIAKLSQIPRLTSFPRNDIIGALKTPALIAALVASLGAGSFFLPQIIRNNQNRQNTQLARTNSITPSKDIVTGQTIASKFMNLFNPLVNGIDSLVDDITGESQVARIKNLEKSQDSRLSTLDSNVLQAASSSAYLQINSDTDIAGVLSENGLRVLTSITGAGSVTVTQGDEGSAVVSFTLPDNIVNTFQGESGDIELVAGTDISISGLTISDTSTLATVRSRAGCSTCIKDADIESLAISKVTGTLTVAKGGTGLTTVATGDLLYGSAADTLSALTVGTAGQILSISGGVPTWTSLSASSIPDDSLDFTQFKDALALDALTTVNQAGFDFGFYGTGNVGIGTTSPNYKLEVIGDTRISGALVVGSCLGCSGGTIAIPDGSATAPSLTFTNDSDIGLWRIGSDHLALTTAGSAFSGLSINADGNVGIGVTNAQYKLEVAGNVSVGGSLTINSLAVAQGGLLISSGQALSLNNDIITDLTGSNLGVSSGALRVIDNPNFSGNLGVGASLTVTGLSLLNGGVSTPSLSVTGLNQGSVVFAGANGQLSQNNPNFYWDSTNNRLGIGTSSVSARLNISGSESTADGQGASLKLSNTATGGSDWYIRSGATGNSTPAGGLSFGDNTAYRMVINSSGNVGIATLTPGYKLEVAGSGYFSGSLGIGISLNVTGNTGIGGSLTVTSLSTFGSHLLPSVDASYDLGSSSNRFRNLYISGSIAADSFADSGLTTGGVLFAGSGGTITTSGANFFFDSTNNRLGVGTSAPARAVEIQRSESTGSPLLRLTNSYTAGTAATGIEFFGPAATIGGPFFEGKIYAAIDGDSLATSRITFQNATTAIATIDTMSLKNGNVGIGTTTPVYKLEVIGNGNFSGNLGIGGTATISSAFRFTPGASSGYALLSDGSGYGTWTDITGSGGGSVGAWTLSGNNLFPDSTNYNVGIGTSSPLQKLHVAGDGYITGNLGIGVSAPSAPLDVNGKIKTTAFQLTTGAGSNYLLTSDASGNGSWAAALSGGFISNDSLDFAQFEDALNLDASTDIATDGFNLTTSGTGALSFNNTGGFTVTNAATFVSTINTNTLTSTALIFSGSGNVNIGATVAGTNLNLLPGSGGLVNLAGGSGSNGCTLDTTNGSFTCFGSIGVGASAGTSGFWSRIGTTLSPSYSGDAVSTSGNISATGAGQVISGGTLLAQNGLTLSTGALSLTSTSGSAALNLTLATNAFNINGNTFGVDTFNNRVGIGTSSPGSTLQVNGNALIGFGGSSGIAPTNGLAVLGNVGIGTSSPTTKLVVMGNVGLGSNDIETWNAGLVSVIESLDTSILFGNDTDIHLASNGYYDTGNTWRYKTTDEAANYYLYQGTHNWRVAASGTVDTAITWTNAMTIINNGNVGVGGDATPDNLFSVGSTSQFQINSSGAIAAVTGITTSGAYTQSGTGINSFTGNVGINNATPIQKLQINATTASLVVDANGNLGIGNTTPTGKLDIFDTTTTGTTLRILSNSLTTGKALDLDINGLTTGTGLDISSTSTALTTGRLVNLDWSPTSAVTATGNLFNIGIGVSGSANALFNIDDAGSSIFSVSESAFSTSLPVNFSSPGDVAIAYDLNFTNPVSSFITSESSLNIRAGKTYNSSDLTLSTYNQGNIVFDSAGLTSTSQQTWTLNNTSTWALDIQSAAGSKLLTFDTTNSRVGIGRTGPNYTLEVTGNGYFSSTLGVGSSLNVAGNVGVGASLSVTGLSSLNGGLTTNSFRLSTSPTSGYALLSDSSGYGTWTDISSLGSGGNVGAWTLAGTSLYPDSLSYNVGIGTSSTLGSKLNVNGGAIIGSSFIGGAAPSNGLAVQGNVGIGTTSPTSFNLQVAGNIGPNADDSYDLGSSSLRFRDLYLGPTSLHLISTAAETTTARNWALGIQENTAGQGNLKFSLAGQDLMHLSTGGNLGIGTTSPGATLSINGNGLFGYSGTSVGPTNGLAVQGNVGIGTTSPSEALHVIGNAIITGSITVGSCSGCGGGTISLADGSASTPGLNFSSDTNTGLWRIGSDQIALTTGGSAFSGLSVNSSGNIGIGTTSAGNFKLQVAGDIGPDADDTYDLGSATNRFRDLYLGPTSLKLVCTTGECGTAVTWTMSVQEAVNGRGNLRLGTSTLPDALNINSSGNLGVGTTNPVQLFQINNSTSNPFVVTSSGNVGIGFTSPDRLLQIASDVSISAGTFGNYFAAGGSQLALTGSSTSALLNKKLVLGLDTTNNYGYIQAGQNLGVGNTTPYNLALNPAGGNVGIGTTIPRALLDVAGGINAHNLTLSGGFANTLSGYVGHSGYTNLSGGLGTGDSDSITNALRLTSTGNLVNIGSIQAGETLLTSSGTFATKVDYTTGASPIGVAVGDVNGDGKADMVVANNGPDTVSVLINSGTGTFATKVDYSTGTNANPWGVDLGDLNGDGKADMVVANNSTSSISVFLNNGDGTFATRVAYTAGSAPYDVTIGDLNGDGKADLAVTNGSSSTLSIFINKGDGTFATKVDYATGTGPRFNAIGDVNGDGKADIATVGISDVVSIFINKGNGTFATKVDYSTGAGTDPFDVAIGDLNGDGKADLAVTNGSSSTLSIFINNGDGTFATKVDYATDSNLRGVAIGDLNGDGKVDLVVTNTGVSYVSVFLNNGNGTFATKVDYAMGSAPQFVAIGDLNGDGKADLAVTESGSAKVSVFINNTFTMLYANASTGNIGIGTSLPGSKLSIFGGVGIGNTGAGGFASSLAPSLGLAIQGNVGIGTTTTANALQIVGSAVIGFSPSAIGPTNGLAVLGNVGIGTTSAGNFKLQVAGDIGPNADDTYDLGSATNRFRDLYLGPTSLKLVCTTGECGSAVTWAMSVQEATSGRGNLRLGTSTLPDALNISSLGNVGIGTTNPTEALHVIGNTIITGSITVGSCSGCSAGSISLSDGTADAPGLKFSSDTNTGLWRIGADQIALTTGGLAHNGLSVNSSGNIGIGTTSGSAMLDVSTTSTGLTTGKLVNLNWSPVSAVTATGNLFNIGIGVSGNANSLFNIQDGGSDIFTVSESAFSTSLPVNFSSPGDVSIAYDLNFTNPTSSFVKSLSSLNIVAGETFGSNDLTLQTYNAGNIVLDTPGGVTLNQYQPWTLNATSTMAWNIQNTSGSNLLSFDTTNTRVGIGRSGPGSFLGVFGNVGIGNSFASKVIPTNGLAVEGNVGIGTTTTLAPLHVSGNGTISGLFMNGNVGIGFTSPAALLDVVGSNPTLQIRNTSTTNFSTLNFANTAASGAQIWLNGASQTNYGGANSLNLITNQSAPIAFYTNAASSPQMVLASGGNLGIGATSPVQRFQVNMNPGSEFVVTSSGNVGIGFTTPAARLDIVDSGTTGTIQRILGNSLTTGKGIDMDINALTTGYGLDITSTSTGLTTGRLVNLDWSPTSAITSTGNLFNIGIGVSGNANALFNIQDAGSDIFTVSESQFSTSLPVNFTSPGDIAVAYDMNFTNPTASYIKSAAPLYLTAGETFNSSDLTLKTYNQGNIILDSWNLWTDGTNMGIGTTTPSQRFQVNANASNPFVVTSGGNVGIGTTSPVGLGSGGSLGTVAHIHSTGANYSQLSVSTDGTTSGNTLGAVVFGTTGVSAAAKQGAVIYSTLTATSASVVTADLVFQLNNAGTIAEKMRIMSSGHVLIGRTTDIDANVKFQVEHNNTPMLINMTGTDGNILSFAQDGTVEGTISVSGTTISYNAFTGSHYAWTNQTIERGMLVHMTGDNRNVRNDPEEEVVYGVEKATIQNDSQIMGSYLSIQNPNKPYGPENPHLIMAVGNGDVWIVDNGQDIKSGDYLLSSDTPGHAMRDNGQFTTSNIIARAAEDVNWNTVTETIDGKKHKKISVFFESFKINNQNPLDSLTFDSQGNLVIPNLKSDKISVESLNIGLGELNGSIDPSTLTSLELASEGQALPRLDIGKSLLKINDAIALQASRVESLESSSAVLGEQVASQSAQLSDINKRLEELAARIASESGVESQESSNSASESATPSDQTLETSDLLDPSFMISTGSAVLQNLEVQSEATFSAQLTAYEATIQSTFKSLGESFLMDTNVAGDLNVQGTMSINSDSINTIGVLKIQDNALAGNIELFGGKVTISTDGSILAVQIDADKIIADELAITANKSAGQGTIPTGEGFTIITNSYVKENSLIILTPRTKSVANLSVVDRISGGFTVATSLIENKDLEFDYIVIGVSP